MPLSRAKKTAYIERLNTYLAKYDQCFLVTADNVGSNQMQQIRRALRANSEVMFGKNTMMRKVLREFLQENPGHPYEQVLALIKGNIGFVFTNGDLAEVKQCILDNKVPAPARSGAISPVKVVVPPGPTGMDPGSTGFFQALNIPTKIAKGQVEIINPVNLFEIGDKVTPGHVVLLNKLGILPFSYGLKIEHVYAGGSVFSPKILDMSENDLVNKFMSGVSSVASLCLEVGFPTLVSLPHSVSKAFQLCASIGLEVDFKFAAMDKLSEAGPAAGGDAAGDAKGDDAAGDAAEAKPDDEPEEEVGLGAGGLDLGGDDY